MMAITYSFCLNLSSPSPPSKIIRSQTQAIAPPRRGDEKWRKQCVAGMAAACVAFGGVAIQMGESDGSAMAKEMTTMTAPTAEPKARWSEKRECPPWHLNSLETIVPENLPRPSAPRRWEAVGNRYLTKDAPPVKVTVTSSRNNCFSM